MMLKTPGGNAALRIDSARIDETDGAFSAGFQTTVFPVIRA